MIVSVISRGARGLCYRFSCLSSEPGGLQQPRLPDPWCRICIGLVSSREV